MNTSYLVTLEHRGRQRSTARAELCGDTGRQRHAAEKTRAEVESLQG
jgi:hypothetical protein